MRTTTVLAAAAAAALGLCAAQARAAEPLKITMAYVVPTGNYAGFVYHKTDIMKNYGKTYTVEPTHYKGTTFMITAMGAGELDIADLAYSSFPIAVENADMSDLKIIAGEIQDGFQDYETGNYYVLKDGPIKTIKDLKGSVIASVGPGTAVDIAIRAILKKNGLEDKRDYQIVTAGFPAMNAMLLEKKAQLVANVHPFDLKPDFQAKARALFTDKEALGGPSQFIILAARESWLKAHHAVVVDWLADLIRANHWWWNPKNHEEAVKAIAGIIHTPPKLFDYKFTKNDLYQDPELIPNVKALQHTADLQHELGFLPHKFDMSKHIDLSYVKEAAKQVSGM